MKRYRNIDIILIFGSLGFFSILMIIVFSFLSGLNSASYLYMVNDGNVIRKITSRYLYNINLKGLILSSSFVISSISLFLYVIYSMVTPQMKSRKAFSKEKVNHLITNTSNNNEDENNIIKSIPGKQPIHEENSIREEELVANVGDAAPNNVIYGNGEIDHAGMVDFIHSFPDTAIKFAFESNINGSELPDGTKELHSKWYERGLNNYEVKKEIQRLLEWEIIDKTKLKEISIELKKIVESNRN